MEQEQTSTVLGKVSSKHKGRFCRKKFFINYVIQCPSLLMSFHETTDELNLDILEFINECFLFKTK